MSLIKLISREIKWLEKIVEKFIESNVQNINSLAIDAFKNVTAQIDISLKTAYRNYLSKTRLKYSKTKSFFIRNQPVELYSYYVPTGIACGERQIPVPNFKTCTSFTSRIVVCGGGGSGKSVLMKHLFLNCIEQTDYVPILIELRDLNGSDKTLDEFINETLSAFEFKTSEMYIKLAKEKGHFSFFFDGFDEVDQPIREKLIKSVKLLSKSYPQCPIFISSRPDDVLNGLDEFSTFKMMPLDLSEAISLVEKLPFDETIKKKFIDDMSNGLFELHKSFLSNPLLLSIMLLTYGENAEIPSKLSIFYEQAYTALFTRHDAYKEGYKRVKLTNLDLQDFAKVFSLFCLQSYEKRLFKMSRVQCLDFIKKSIAYLRYDINPEDYLTDLLSAACLLIEDGLEITFTHRSFQEYFVAHQISVSPPEIQKKLIELFWTKIQRDNVMHLLHEINETLFEREVIIPKLEKLFYEILGVKRTFGISHYLKYMSYIHDSFILEEDGLFTLRTEALSSGDRGALYGLIYFVLDRYSNFKFPSKEEFKTLSEPLFHKYVSSSRKTTIKVKNLTTKSPFLLELTQFPSHSIDLPRKLIELHKKLKSKHNNSAQNFENLLDIK